MPRRRGRRCEDDYPHNPDLPAQIDTLVCSASGHEVRRYRAGGCESPMFRMVLIYFNGGNTIGSGACDAGQDLLYLAAISPITRSQRSFPKLL